MDDAIVPTSIDGGRVFLTKERGWYWLYAFVASVPPCWKMIEAPPG